MQSIKLSCPQRKRSLVKALGLSVVLLLTPNFNTVAQDAPPLPGGGSDTKPYEPTPEEREAMRQAEEARWKKNAESFQPWLVLPMVFAGQPIETLAKLDDIQRARLLSLGEENKLKNEASLRAAMEWAARTQAPTRF